MEEKVKGVIAYLTGFIGGFIFLFAKDSSKALKKHAAQSVVVSLGLWVIAYIGGLIPIIGWFIISPAAWILSLIILILGAIKAYNEEEFNIFVFTNIADSIFAQQINEEK